MDIRPGHSPGSIFGAADNNPLVQSFDEESPDSVLNPDGSVGYLAARLTKERGARVRTQARDDVSEHVARSRGGGFE